LRETKPTTSKEIVLFANPDFNLTQAGILALATNQSSANTSDLRGAEKRGLEDLSFSPLEGTKTESDRLAGKFKLWEWDPLELNGDKATKEELLRMQSPYILHLATHGFFAPAEPAASQSESKPLQLEKEVTRSKFFENPMHRSGLALAGAQTTLEAWKRGEVPPVDNDGILTADEVGSLNLTGTWLVTLSACDTGSGEAKAGEGVMGLRRGFIEAGAQNLLMTLWPISDETTVQIMIDFYEAAHASGNAPEALARIQRDWLVSLREKEGLVKAVQLAGPFIMSFQGKP
jgi:CHAT domain-containing protein